jgi:hypothetical protein
MWLADSFRCANYMLLLVDEGNFTRVPGAPLGTNIDADDLVS